MDTRPARTGRKAGFVIAILVNAGLWIVINVRPGWQSFDFLTPSFADVLPVINLSLIVGALINAAYLVIEERWFRHLGQLLVSIIGMIVAWRLLAVFPFEPATDWEPLVRTVLILALLGSGVAALVEFARLIRGDGR
jgi:hypothetical protein